MNAAIVGGWVAAAGLVAGSFFSCMVYRQIRGISLWGRSQCPNCGRILNFLDLIPVLGYLLQHGRCRHCQAKISPYYSLVEIGFSGLYCVFYAEFGLSIQFAVAAALSLPLLAMAVTDGLTGYIYDLHWMTAAVIAFAYRCYSGLLNMPLFYTVLVAFLLTTIPYVAGRITANDYIGSGDIALNCLVALILGDYRAYVLVLALTAALMAGYFCYRKFRLKIVSHSFPQAPFMVAALGLFLGKNWIY
jgi:leader peptidase (prepilin peptidase)/N-methyltransferase